MKCIEIQEAVEQNGIPVEREPYPHVVLGEGGHKRATWIPLGNRDADAMIKRVAVSVEVWKNKEDVEEEERILDAGVIALRNKKTKELTGRYLLVKPHNPDNKPDTRVLVLWRVESGYRGTADIEALDERVVVVGYDHAWASGRGALGETAEMLAIVLDGARLSARISGRRVQLTRAILQNDGGKISVVYGGQELLDAIDDTDGDEI